MTRAERVLFHQVHPLKLAADIGSTVVAIPLLWSGDTAIGLAVALSVPVVGSAIVLAAADLRGIASSPVGTYLRRFMTPPVQAVRLAMGLVVLWAASLRSAGLVAAAVAVIAVAWSYGLLGRRA